MVALLSTKIFSSMNNIFYLQNPLAKTCENCIFFSYLFLYFTKSQNKTHAVRGVAEEEKKNKCSHLQSNEANILRQIDEMNFYSYKILALPLSTSFIIVYGLVSATL